MSLFRKKPVVVEAIEYLGDNAFAEPEPAWLADARLTRAVRYVAPLNQFIVHTLEGEHLVLPGAFLVRGVEGELYPCKPSIFAETYEPVGAEP